MRLSVCMILGRCDEKLIATFDSVNQIADEVVIVQTVEHDPTTRVVKDYNFNCQLNYAVLPDLNHEDGFLRSFAEARNESFKPATGDMIMWIDSDDVIFNPTGLRDAIENIYENGVDGKKISQIRMDYDYEFDENGNCTTRHKRERIVRNDHFEWIAPIHEILSPTRFVNAFDLPRDVSYIVHNNIKGKDQKSRKHRNVKMLERIVEDGGDQRMKMYYAHSLTDIGEYAKAIEYYMEYLKESKWDEERHQVMMRIHNVYREMNEYKLAAAWCFQAIDLEPKFNSPYLALAEIAGIMKKWDRAIHWIKMYDQCESMKETMIHNPTGEGIQPYMILQNAYYEKGDYEKCMSCTQTLRELMPSKSDMWDDLDTFCMNQIQDKALIKSYEHVINNTPEEDRQDIYDNIPDAISDYPMFKPFKRKHRPQGQKVVAIFCGHDNTQKWGPESIKTGIGGSEEAVINMSREFRDLGWTVEVYCNCTNEGEIDGVNWYGADASNPSDIVDLCILWRHPRLVYGAPRGRVTFLWNHDLQDNMEPFYDEDVMQRIDKVLFLSEFHRTTAPWVPDDKVMITRNGVDPELIVSGDNDPYTVVYASSPDRGLDTILGLWPRVVETHPKARLKVFYGFNKWFDARYKDDSEKMKWKQRLLQTMEKDPTITYYGSVGQDVLAKEISSCGIWAYPTTFGEISCITAMKMQCGGAVPVTTDYAALHETCRHGYQIGEYLEPIFDNDEFLQTLINLVGDSDQQKLIRDYMVPDARETFPWSKVAKEWECEFKQLSEKQIERIEQ